MTAAPALTSELLDLMEHEKVIEQGIASMLDMAWAYERIRDGRKYRARGYGTFADYCEQWWHLSQQHVGRIIEASHAYRAITEPIGSSSPSLPPSGGESQLRPLAPLRDDPAAQKAVWDEAVKEANGKQPTAKQVERAVAKRQPPKREHPAPFSDPILEQAAGHLNEAGVTGTVLDPFAGTGRVHELRARLGVKTLGVEIEPEWAAKHRDTVQGDARELTNFVAPGSVDAIVTSPTYGNRMADHHDAKDDSVGVAAVLRRAPDRRPYWLICSHLPRIGSAGDIWLATVRDLFDEVHVL